MMKKYFSVFLLVSVLPGISFASSARFTQLVREKQQKMEQLEKCAGATKGLKIAGVSTLGLTAVGVAGNIAEAKIINDNKKTIDKNEKRINAAREDLNKSLKAKEERDAQREEERRIEQENAECFTELQETEPFVKSAQKNQETEKCEIVKCIDGYEPDSTHQKCLVSCSDTYLSNRNATAGEANEDGCYIARCKDGYKLVPDSGPTKDGTCVAQDSQSSGTTPENTPQGTPEESTTPKNTDPVSPVNQTPESDDGNPQKCTAEFLNSHNATDGVYMQNTDGEYNCFIKVCKSGYHTTLNGRNYNVTTQGIDDEVKCTKDGPKSGDSCSKQQLNALNATAGTLDSSLHCKATACKGDLGLKNGSCACPSNKIEKSGAPTQCECPSNTTWNSEKNICSADPVTTPGTTESNPVTTNNIDLFKDVQVGNLDQCKSLVRLYAKQKGLNLTYKVLNEKDKQDYLTYESQNNQEYIFEFDDCSESFASLHRWPVIRALCKIYGGTPEDKSNSSVKCPVSTPKDEINRDLATFNRNYEYVTTVEDSRSCNRQNMDCHSSYTSGFRFKQ